MEERMTVKFNVMMPETLYQRIEAWAEQCGTSRGQVVRAACDAMMRQCIDETPICANGGPCYVPHMHPRRLGPAAQPVVAPAAGKE